MPGLLLAPAARTVPHAGTAPGSATRFTRNPGTQAPGSTPTTRFPALAVLPALDGSLRSVSGADAFGPWHGGISIDCGTGLHAPVCSGCDCECHQ